MKSKRELFYVIRDISVMTIAIIGPFILEHSNQNCVVWIMLAVTASGGIYGFGLFRLNLSIRYLIAGYGLFLAVFWGLILVRGSIGPTYFNWTGGLIAGTVFAARPAQREAEAKDKEEPTPGWYLNNEKLATGSIATSRALLALQNLDGSTHYFLSLTFGASRFDIVGDYHQGVVVFCAPDSRAMKNWSILLGPGSNKKTFELRVARDRVTLPTNNLVTAKSAQEALTYFISHQTPDPNHKWLTGREAFYRRPPSTR